MSLRCMCPAYLTSPLCLEKCTNNPKICTFYHVAICRPSQPPDPMSSIRHIIAIINP